MNNPNEIHRAMKTSPGFEKLSDNQANYIKHLFLSMDWDEFIPLDSFPFLIEILSFFCESRLLFHPMLDISRGHRKSILTHIMLDLVGK